MALSLVPDCLARSQLYKPIVRCSTESRCPCGVYYTARTEAMMAMSIVHESLSVLPTPRQLAAAQLHWSPLRVMRHCLPCLRRAHTGCSCGRLTLCEAVRILRREPTLCLCCLQTLRQHQAHEQRFAMLVHAVRRHGCQHPAAAVPPLYNLSISWHRHPRRGRECAL